ncbi:MAG: hypothetical protein MJZ33_14590 [Paludibacteraceae bacterium]|nr:hypothetical protein [Paludibacteraceae bacterium]MCQ2219687.1 hypothetical protein [Paludibacteraceae bacterium]
MREVPTLEKEIPNLLLQMHEEIPAFLYFLNKRKISVPHKTRTWFDEELLKTDALQRLKEEQRPRPIKLIETFIKEMVEDFKIKEVIINETQLCERVAGLKKYENQIRQVIMQHMKADVTRASNGNPSPVRYSLPRYQYTLDASMSDVVWEKFRGRAFVFKAEDYLSEEELKMIFPKEPEQGVLNFEEKQE